MFERRKITIQASILAAGNTSGLNRSIDEIPFCPLSPTQYLAKRIFDLTAGSIALLALVPAMCLIAIMVKLTSPGPVIFRQPRYGRHSKLFNCYKFRTMRHEESDLLCETQTVHGDQRVTKIGRLLRRLSFDELPQLFNVIGGDMSLVGPRPHAPLTKAGGILFTEISSDYHKRHSVLPGITGWAQVNGYRGPTNTQHDGLQRVALDLFYIENWSLWFDLKILVKTVVVAAFDTNAV